MVRHVGGLRGMLGGLHRVLFKKRIPFAVRPGENAPTIYLCKPSLSHNSYLLLILRGKRVPWPQNTETQYETKLLLLLSFLLFVSVPQSTHNLLLPLLLLLNFC